MHLDEIKELIRPYITISPYIDLRGKKMVAEDGTDFFVNGMCGTASISMTDVLRLLPNTRLRFGPEVARISSTFVIDIATGETVVNPELEAAILQNAFDCIADHIQGMMTPK